MYYNGSFSAVINLYDGPDYTHRLKGDFLSLNSDRELLLTECIDTFKLHIVHIKINQSSYNFAKCSVNKWQEKLQFV